MAVQGGYGQAQQFQAMALAAERASFHVGKLAGNAIVLQAALQVLAPVTRAFGELEQSLTLTQSVAQGTTKEFKQMETAARNFALGMRFSATEASNAMYFLASAGFSVQQSISAMSGVMNFAQATMSDVGQSADMIAGAIMAFGLAAKDATRVSNLFAASIAVSQADAAKLAYSMRQVAPVAKAMGATIEETTAQLSILYNVGLRGEQAGTALRNSMVRLMNPTKQAKEVFDQMGVSTANFDGSARKLNDILVDISKINPDNFTIKMLVEDEALAGMQALLQAANPEEFIRKMGDAQFAERASDIAKRAGKDIKDVRNELELMELAISNTNSASRMAMAQTTTLSGSFSLAKNALTEFSISFGQTLAPGLQSIANTITNLGVAFRNLNDDQQKFIGTLALMVPAIYGVVKAAQATSGALMAMGGAYNNVVGAYKAHQAAAAAASFIGPGMAGSAVHAAQTGAAVSGAARLAGLVGGIGGVITIIGGALGIATLIGMAWPTIQKFVSSKGKESSQIPEVDLKSTVTQRLQSIMLGGGSAFDRASAVAEQRALVNEMVTEWEKLLTFADNKKKELGDNFGKAVMDAASIAPSDMSTAFRGMLEGAVKSDAGLEGLSRIFNSKSDRSAPKGRIYDEQKFLDWLAANNKELYDRVMRYSKDLQVQRSNAETAVKNIASKGNILELLDQAERGYKAMPDYLPSVQKNDMQKLEEAARFSFVSQDFIRELRRDARAKETELAKARLDLMRDPAAEFLVTLMTERERIATTAITQAEQRAAKISELFGNLPVNLKNLITGNSYRDLGIITEMVDGKEKMRDETNPNAAIKKGWLQLFQEGATPEEIRAAAKEASDAVLARIPSMAANVRAVYRETNEIINGQLVEAMIEEQQIARQKAFGDQLQKAGGDSVFMRSMREMLMQQQLDFVKQVTAGAANVTTGFGLANELAEAFAGLQQSNNRMLDQITAFWTRFDPTRSISKGKEQVEAFSKSYTDQMNAMYRVKVRDIIERAKMAREKMADEIRAAQSDAKAQKSSLMAELYVLSGLSGEYREAAIGNEIDKINAEADRRIAALNEQIRQLRFGIASAQMAKGELSGIGALPGLQVPTAADAATTVHRSNVESLLNAIVMNTARMGGALPEGPARTSNVGGSGQIVPGLYDDFGARLKMLMEAVPGISITSGLRSRAEQARLYAEKPHLAAPPGSSNHEYGLAADLKFKDDATRAEAHRRAAEFGLAFPMLGQNGGKNEPWHIEIENARALRQELSQLSATRREAAQGTQQATVQEQAMVMAIANEKKVAGENVKTWADLEQAMKRAGYTETEIRNTIDQNKAAIERQVAAQKELLRQKEAEIPLIERIRQLQSQYADSPGMRAYRDWQFATAEVEMYGKSIERTGSVIEGFRYQQQKMTLQLMTDSQLGAQVFQQGVDGIAGALAGLISGTVKDWRQALSQLAQQIAQTILKALIMKSILSVFGFSSGGTPGAPGNELGGLYFNGGIPVLANAKGNTFGGMVNSKQYFPMAGGRVGSIAETGSPEAIMPLGKVGGRLGVYEASTGRIIPLRRGYGGKLGVDAFEDGGTVTPIVGSGRGSGSGGGFTYVGGDIVINGGGNQGGGQGMDRTQAENMKREMDREIETAVLRVYDRHSRAGGVMNPKTRRS